MQSHGTPAVQGRLPTHLLGAAVSQMALPKTFLVLNSLFFIMIFGKVLIWGHEWCCLVSGYDERLHLCHFSIWCCWASIKRNNIFYWITGDNSQKQTRFQAQESFLGTETASLSTLDQPSDQSTATLPTLQVLWKSYLRPPAEEDKWAESIFYMSNKWHLNPLFKWHMGILLCKASACWLVKDQWLTSQACYFVNFSILFWEAQMERTKVELYNFLRSLMVSFGSFICQSSF